MTVPAQEPRATQTVALHGVDAHRTYDLADVRTGESLGIAMIRADVPELDRRQAHS